MRTKRQNPQPAMSENQARQLVGHMTAIMHVIPDRDLERLVETLTAEMRRRGMRREGPGDEDEVPF